MNEKESREVVWYGFGARSRLNLGRRCLAHLRQIPRSLRGRGGNPALEA